MTISSWQEMEKTVNFLLKIYGFDIIKRRKTCNMMCQINDMASRDVPKTAAELSTSDDLMSRRRRALEKIELYIRWAEDRHLSARCVWKYGFMHILLGLILWSCHKKKGKVSKQFRTKWIRIYFCPEYTRNRANSCINGQALKNNLP